MNHRRLFRFAVLMWALPLAAGSATLLAFLFLRSPLFVTGGMVLLVAGGLCLSAGIAAVIAIFTTRNSFRESPRRYYRKKALSVLGLLLANLPVAAGYAVLAGALLDPAAVEAAASPSGRWLAETIYLGERDQPPYGMAVTLRPQPGLFWHESRSVVFAAYCLNGPALDWQNGDRLLVRCTDPRNVSRQLTRYREVAIRYRFEAAPPARAKRNSK